LEALKNFWTKILDSPGSTHWARHCTEPPRGEGEEVEVSAPCSQPRRLHDLRVGIGAGHAADPNPTRRILLRLPACLVLRPFFSSSTERRRRDLGSPSLGRPFVLGAEQRALPVSQATQEPAVQHIRNRTPRNEGMELMVESTNHRRLAALQVLQRINPTQAERGRKRK